MTQIPLPLGAPDPAYEREAFMVGPANKDALAAIDRWPDWPDQLLFVIGPEGAGKSHLGEIWRRASGAARIAGPDLTAEALPGLLEQGALVLDKADEISDEPAFFLLINLAREARISVLLLSRTPPEAMAVSRPDLASRLGSLPRVSLQAPDEAMMADLLIKRLSDRQLGQVTDEVVHFIVSRIGRSHAWVERAAQALDEESLVRRSGPTMAAAKAAMARLSDEPVNQTDA